MSNIGSNTSAVRFDVLTLSKSGVYLDTLGLVRNPTCPVSEHPIRPPTHRLSAGLPAKTLASYGLMPAFRNGTRLREDGTQIERPITTSTDNSRQIGRSSRPSRPPIHMLSSAIWRHADR